jgi:hypothetical protein
MGDKVFEYIVQMLGPKVIIFVEIAQRDIFLEKNMRFRLILGWLAILKK